MRHGPWSDYLLVLVGATAILAILENARVKQIPPIPAYSECEQREIKKNYRLTAPDFKQKNEYNNHKSDCDQSGERGQVAQEDGDDNEGDHPVGMRYQKKQIFHAYAHR